MSRMARRGMIVIGAVVVLAAVSALVAVVAAGGGEEIPTARIERQEFVRVVPAEGILRSAQSTILAVPRETDERLRIAWLAPEGSRLEAGDVVVRFDPTEIERTLENSEADLASNALKLDKQETEKAEEIANLERDIETARRELEHSREFASQDEVLYSRVEILESAIDQELAQERLEHHETSRERAERLAATDRELLAIERRKVQLDHRRAAQALDALELTTPHAGILVYRRDWRGEMPRVGENVFPGNPIAEIPDLDAMEAEVFVLEADAGGLEAGKKARLFLESVPGRFYEATIARVENLAKPRFRGSPVQYFAVVLELAETDPTVMKPGQRVRAELLLESIENALTVPRQAVFEVEGETVVYVETGAGPTGFEPVPVEVRSSGLGRVAVVGELEPGTRVALADPIGNAKTPSEAFEEMDTPPPPPPAGRGMRVMVF